MIPVTLTALTWIYVILFLGLIGLCWGASMVRFRLARRRIRRTAIRCRLCAGEFTDETDAPLPRCPVCNAPNERIPLVRL